ncbi:MAG: putative toxin-antitoxin system toxin component, PIN family [Thaumarchaeota archaeon]|nr:putative toxin-antitoxin system toxin component, PIN family [Nitrososphaerota archaeon]
MGEKVVLGTNVWVSILLNKTLAKTFVPLIEAKEIEPCMSYALLREAAKVLTYPRIDTLLREAKVRPEAALASIIRAVKLVNPRKSVRVVKEDPADDRVLECALAAKAKFIISGDHHLLALKEYRGIRILKPREFLECTLDLRSNDS